MSSSPRKSVIGDRFIPSSSSLSAYKVSNSTIPNFSTFSSSGGGGAGGGGGDISSIDLSSRDDSFYARTFPAQEPNGSFTSQESSRSCISRSLPRCLSPLDLHHDVVAEALEFDQNSKVFRFNYTYQAPPPGRPVEHRSRDRISEKIKKGSSKKSEPPVQSILANDILQAPGLRNDYYSNLVSWSSRTNRVIVGLSSKIYIWGGDDYVNLVNCDNEELVTAISCCPMGYLVLVATANGSIIIIDQKDDRNEVVCEFQLNHGRCIFCFAWFDSEDYFLAGDDSGEVYIFEKIIANFNCVKIQIVNSFKCHQQQICGLALNMKNDEVAVGANDNCCTIWNLQDFRAPLLKFVLPHNAAIKALAYCPWTTSLLATGGGSKDRKIRFWHTASGTLLKEFYTDGQITSIIWSRYKKEIVATFGFGGSTKSNLMRVYSYPQMIPILEVNASQSLRILSAATSPDFCSICVATNDSTIRIYDLWHISSEIASNPSCRVSGAYGSEIIELAEGIHKSLSVIR
ncbi:uncharacterized protein LODBEIA_P33450 [Lodderomyces beijingensis]|uniref:CDC20/Fizzy WD40 domain-containing protein n=1 Tax=Lodderomyces beijingensis TaxID=1775926 RepID=A0ABP0ZQB9_9ASCO